MLRGLTIAALSCLGFATACDAPRATSARASVDCRRWQTAYCAWAASHCHAIDRDACDLATRAIECSDDGEARYCADAIGTAPCGVPPEGCGIADLAARQPAIDACLAVVEATCSAYEECADGADRCAAAASVPCERALGIQRPVEDCVYALGYTGCDQDPPPECTESIAFEEGP